LVSIAARDSEHLLLAARELAAAVVLAFRQTRERIVDALDAPAAAPPPCAQAQMLVDAERAPESASLRNVADPEPRDLGGLQARQKISRDAVEQRRLAGPIGAQNRAALARPRRQRHVGESGERAEQPRHAAQFERVAGSDGGEALSDAIDGRRTPGPH
jgi:hypothetical protein